MDLITKEKAKKYLKEWLDEAIDDVPAEFIMAIDYQKKEESDRTIYYQKKEESDEEKIDKERALRILERRKNCIEKIANDACPDDCRLCNSCVTDKTLTSALEYAINHLKEESDEVRN